VEEVLLEPVSSSWGLTLARVMVPGLDVATRTLRNKIFW